MRLKFDIPAASDVFTESRNLLKSIQVKDVTKNFTIPQILSYPWFTSRTLSYEPELPCSSLLFRPDALQPRLISHGVSLKALTQDLLRLQPRSLHHSVHNITLY